jgi:Mg2+/citrate symporter
MLHKYPDFLDKLPPEGESLRLVDEELCRLYSHELARSDGWTNKGLALLGASGLVLALAALGHTALMPPDGLCTWWQAILFLLSRPLAFFTALVALFLSLLYSLRSLSPHRVYGLHPDDLANIALIEGTEARRILAAMRWACYKNNVATVNSKATWVNRGWQWFLVGCVSQTVFVASLALWASRS